jgi:hypothetical protein
MLARSSALSCLVLSLLTALELVGQDFRVETEVFVDEEVEPKQESLTLFSGDVVYDFMLSPLEETTIFDTRRDKLVVLDAKRQVKTTLTTNQLAEFSAAIKTRGMQPGLTGLFQPKFDSSYDEQQLRITLTSDWLTYKAKGLAAKHPDGAQRYRQFADWHARLNAIRPGNLPPFGRLELNQALADRGLVPVEIERTVVLDRLVTNKILHAKSKHAINWILSNTDRGRIEQAGKNLVKFEEIAPANYWSAPEQTARTAPSR